MAVASGGVAEAEGGRVVGVSLGSLSGVGQIETNAHVMCSTLHSWYRKNCAA